jgi:hypothetical protein
MALGVSEDSGMIKYRIDATTKNANGLYQHCWVVTNIDLMRVAVFTSHKALQQATLSCAEASHLYHVDVCFFEGELPNDGNIQSALLQVKNTFLDEEKLAYFNWLRGVRDGRLNPPSQTNAVTNLRDRLTQVYNLDKRERYDNE